MLQDGRSTIRRALRLQRRALPSRLALAELFSAMSAASGRALPA
jgi:hypothetical protein